MKTEPVHHVSHPFKVQGYACSSARRVLIGRAMFRTKEEASAYAKGAGAGGDDLPVLTSKPSDTAFA